MPDPIVPTPTPTPAPAPAPAPPPAPPAPAPTPTPTPQPAATQQVDLTSAIENLIHKNRGTHGALHKLLTENFELREKERQTEARYNAPGTRLLTAEEASQYQEYVSLGKPEEIRTLKTEHGTLSATLTAAQRDEQLRTFADKVGVKFAVLKTLAGNLDFTAKVKVKDPKTGAETEELAVKDGENEPKPFREYATEKWPDFVSALYGTATPPNTKPSIAPRRSAQPLPPVQPQEQQRRKISL